MGRVSTPSPAALGALVDELARIMGAPVEDRRVRPHLWRFHCPVCSGMDPLGLYRPLTVSADGAVYCAGYDQGVCWLSRANTLRLLPRELALYEELSR